jgi:tRNA-(ms[2]io[6]A)-hydroxylase
MTNPAPLKARPGQVLMQGKKLLDISPLLAFLGCETPDSWVDAALKNESILLIDHANCEKKAASTALSLLYRYVDRGDLLRKLSKLSREELRHFEQVIAIMEKRGIAYKHISPSGYAAGLHKHIARQEPDKLTDTLIVGAFIEARSCERFAKLAPHLDNELNDFYCSLLKSESRHFRDYLNLAKQYANEDIQPRVDFFCEIESQLILEADSTFRFHSGVPVS